jgi:hypothetical protein
MSPKENLLHLIEKMTDDQVAELERVATSMLQAGQPRGESCAAMTFDEAKAYVFTEFDTAFRNLPN